MDYVSLCLMKWRNQNLSDFIKNLIISLSEDETQTFYTF